MGKFFYEVNGYYFDSLAIITIMSTVFFFFLYIKSKFMYIVSITFISCYVYNVNQLLIHLTYDIFMFIAHYFYLVYKLHFV